MKLEFDSVEELGQFLHWAVTELAPRMSSKPISGTRSTLYTTGAPGAATTIGTLVGIAGAGASGSAGTGASGSAGVAFDTPPDGGEMSEDTQAALDRVGAACSDPATEQAATKRKRRTKAEIEAAAAAEAKSEEAAALAAAVVSGEAQPAGANPFDRAAFSDTAAEDMAAISEGDEKASNEPEVVTPFQHLTRAREFIAKHGMPKYNESFAKAGLDANVMGYSAYQRGLHMDALDALEKA